MQYRRRNGFTLIELMIVVAIVGILAVLAIFGVRQHLAASKGAEAKNALGAINRAAVAAYERETAPSEITTGGSSGSALQQLCKTSTAVPTTTPSSTKYTATGTDYHVPGEAADTGWTCLGFEMTGPQYYQYQYERGSKSSIATIATPPAGASWLAVAVGDLDGNGVKSNFVTGGMIDASKRPITFTEIATANPEE
jgi:type IV pilus assembly protein PilA